MRVRMYNFAITVFYTKGASVTVVKGKNNNFNLANGRESIERSVSLDSIMVPAAVSLRKKMF